MRRCLYDPIEPVFEAALLLSLAVSADLSGDEDEARRLLVAADRDDLRAWVLPIFSSFRRLKYLPTSPAVLSRAERPTPRMPGAAIKRAVLERDGHHCRFCGMPVVAAETRKAIKAKYGPALRWEGRDETHHAAFLTCWLQFDHVLPNSRGGTSDAENIVIACAPCNFGRMEFTLEEAGLSDPRTFTPDPWAGHPTWKGLQEFLRK